MTDIERLIQQIENSNSKTELDKFSQNISSEILNKISMRIVSNQQQIKSIVMENTDNLITLFKNIKLFNEELKKSRRNYDLIEQQVSIFNKKYTESELKMTQSTLANSNIDLTLQLIEKIKSFSRDIKLLKLYYERENNILLDTDTPFKCFLNITKILSNSNEEADEINNLSKINILKNDLLWFKENKDRLLNLFRNKFHDMIKVQDNKQIVKYFEFFNEQGLLLDEVKNFSNKVLKEMLNEAFFKKIVSTNINSINIIDMVGQNISNIRRELKEFFTNLSKWTFILDNLGSLLNNSLSKKDLVLYEELMEADGLKGIYHLYSDKVQSSFIQIVQKIRQNDKLSNAFNYLVKDYLFFYFCIKNYSKRNKIEINTNELKQIFLDKFTSITNENLSRALNLIISLRKSSLCSESKLIDIYIIIRF